MPHPVEPNTLSDFKALKNIYFMGIAGTGMAAAAGLCHQAGYRISGSDQKVFPPMSDLLEDLGVEVKQPYKANQFEAENPDVVVVANALSRGHEELESALEKGLPVTSFAELVGNLFLEKPSSVVVKQIPVI